MMKNEENRELIINENGEAFFESEDGIIKKDSFTEEQKSLITSIISNSVETIGKEAFMHCTNLKSIKFPKAKTIEYHAFHGCRNLETVDLPEVEKIRTKAFCDCSSLVNIDFPKAGVIEEKAFELCELLETIKLPCIITLSDYLNMSSTDLIETNRLIKVANCDIFEGCKNLTEIHTSDINQCKEIYYNLNEYQKERFKKEEIKIYYKGGMFNIEQEYLNFEPKDYIISSKDIDRQNMINATKVSSDSATIIDEFIFESFEDLESIDFPKVITLKKGAFYFCYKLKNIVLPKVTTIENNVFYCCENIKKIDIPDVTTIGKMAFGFCSNLEIMDLPNVIKIEENAFESCENLSKIYIPKIKDIGSETFKGCKNLTEIYTSNIEACKKVYLILDENQKTKVKNKTLKIYYESEIFNPTEIE